MVKKASISFAKIAWAFDVSGPVQSIFWAAAPANVQVPAYKALIRQFAFPLGESAFSFVACEFVDRGFGDIAEPPGLFHEEITAKRVAVMLDDDVVAAFGHKGAFCVLDAEAKCDYAVECADADLFLAVLLPPVEYPAHKIAVLFGCDAEIGDPARFWILLDALDELQEADLFVDEEIEQFVRVADVMVAQEDEDIEIDPGLSASFDRSGYLVERALASVIEAVVVVVFFGPIEAYPDEEPVFGEELAPFIVEEDAVGLQGIGYDLSIGAVFFLQAYQFFVKIQAHQRWLSTLPGKATRLQPQLEVVFDQPFEYVRAHSMGTGAEYLGLAGVKAVSARDIAVGAGWFYQ